MNVVKSTSWRDAYIFLRCTFLSLLVFLQRDWRQRQLRDSHVINFVTNKLFVFSIECQLIFLYFCGIFCLSSYLLLYLFNAINLRIDFNETLIARVRNFFRSFFSIWVSFFSRKFSLDMRSSNALRVVYRNICG